MTLRSEPSKTPVVSPALQAVSVTRMSSEHDQAVLNSIFNPYLPLGEGLSVSGLIEENDKNGNFVLIIMLSYTAFNGYWVFNKNNFMKSMLYVFDFTQIFTKVNFTNFLHYHLILIFIICVLFILKRWREQTIGVLVIY